MFSKKHICGGCGEKVNARKAPKGSLLILIILLILFIIPGLIYLIWMLSNRQDQCPKCKSLDVVPLKSPRGKALAQQYS